MGPKTTKKLQAVCLKLIGRMTKWRNFDLRGQRSQKIWLSMFYVILFYLQYILRICCYVINKNTCNILNTYEKETHRVIPDW